VIICTLIVCISLTYFIGSMNCELCNMFLSYWLFILLIQVYYVSIIIQFIIISYLIYLTV
jgi:hypothetical protein